MATFSPDPIGDIVADIRTGRLQWLHIRDESLAPLIPALADLPASSRMRLTVMVGDEQALRPILAAVAPIVQTLFLAQPRRVQDSIQERDVLRPRMASFPFMPRLECLVCQASGDYDQRAQRITDQLLIPHAATLRHLVLRRLPDFQEKRDLSRLGAALRSMPRLESLAIYPSGLMRMYVVPVARFAIFGGPLDDYRNSYYPTCPLLPLPASLTGISLALVKDHERKGGPSEDGAARFLPDPEDLPRTVRHVCFFQSDMLTREEVRAAVAGLFEALPAVELVEDRTTKDSYTRGAATASAFAFGSADPPSPAALVVGRVREQSFHDFGPARTSISTSPSPFHYAGAPSSIEERCAELERQPGGWNELAMDPCVAMRQIAYGEVLGPEEIVYSRSEDGGLVLVRKGSEPEPEPEPEPPLPPPLRLVHCTDVLSPLAEAARRCAGILRFVVSPSFHPLFERGAAAVASIMADHPEMTELTFHCPSMSDQACESIASAVCSHPNLRIVRVSMDRPHPWKQRLLLAVLEANAARRRCDLDRAAWKVVMAGVRHEMEMAAEWGRWYRHVLPWHMHSIGGRIADFLGRPEPAPIALASDDSTFDDPGWMLWFLPGRTASPTFRHD